MAALSAAAKNAMLDDYLTGTWYLSAYIGDPLGAGSEVSTSGTAYARQAVTFAAAASGGKATNSAANFPVATANYGTVDHLALFAAVTGGSPVAAGAFTGVAVNTGGQLEVASGGFSVSLT
jgi:hypothetical protein